MRLYIGELPPPYGGVAVKNKLVYEKIYADNDTEFIDLVECKRHKWKILVIFLKIFKGIFSSTQIVYGLGTNFRLKTLLTAQKILIGKKGLSKTVILVMGGGFHNAVVENYKYLKLVQQVGGIWVESNVMKEKLNALGVKRVEIFPNCRSMANEQKPNESFRSEPLKCVFFSRICEAKGVPVILEAIKKLSDRTVDVCFDFYGEIDDEIHNDFLGQLSSLPNAQYHGVFDATEDNVYNELNQYDLVLLPTHWRGEGVPGVLVEAKISGITAVVSDWNYNREIVVDGEDGIVLEDVTSDALVSAIEQLARDRKYLNDLKCKAFESRLKYDINAYRDKLLRF